MYKLTLVQKFLRIKVYNALPLPTVLYESEIWTVILKDTKLLTLIAIKFFRRSGYTPFDHKRNEVILHNLKLEPVDEKLRRYKRNCLRRVTRLENKIPKVM